MDIRDTDIKVLGRITAITTAGIVASAELIYDDSFTPKANNLAYINSYLKTSLDQNLRDVASLDLELKSNYVRNENVITETQIKALFI